jgi:RNA polymerase sigma factor for flagellar operon FliA
MARSITPSKRRSSSRLVTPPTVPADSPEVLARFHAEIDLVEINAHQLARRLSRAVTFEDLRSFGHEGLLRAARTFDAAKGLPFRRWANLRIKGAMIDGLRRWGGLPRRLYRDLQAMEAGDRLLEAYDAEDAANPAMTPEAADARLTAYLAGLATAIAVGTLTAAPSEDTDAKAYEVTPEDRFARSEMIARVKAIVAALPRKERTLVERHYFAGDTLDDAAASLGLSKSWGSRLHARAIRAIADKLQGANEAQATAPRSFACPCE